MWYRLTQLIMVATVFYVVVASQNPLMLGFALVVIPFVMIHWTLDTDSCVVQMAESWVRGCTKSQSIVQNILGDIYRINHLDQSGAYYVFALLVWFGGMWRLCNTPLFVRLLTKLCDVFSELVGRNNITGADG